MDNVKRLHTRPALLNVCVCSAAFFRLVFCSFLHFFGGSTRMETPQRRAPVAGKPEEMLRSAVCAVIVALAAAQVPVAPMYSACGPTVACAAPSVCQASVCVPVAAAPPVLAAPAPVPMYAPAPVPVPAPVAAPMYAPAPAPVYAPAPAPLLAPAPAPLLAPPAPVVAAAPACAPACLGAAQCVAGACQCAQPAIAYSPVIGCSPQIPVAPVPVAPAPVIAGRLIPQALPGAPCEPGVECTGGSVCSVGVCLCPPELVQEGTVCVARTIYGVVPPPTIVVPAPVVAPVAPLVPVALGSPCAPVAAAPPCVSGAVCSSGVCQCGPAFTPVPGGCVRRRHRKDESKEEKH
ncbi:unnamed protein product [Caenorhabditis auriculariae]|uniref:EB domain-containing protein n=1 Tax=Caenorhabditis auriculariae TaxID=2777116 RepID=A0A8S1I0P1_9PELO|nr:unnamed protein product [Caenorhabditis auriculariae]